MKSCILGFVWAVFLAVALESQVAAQTPSITLQQIHVELPVVRLFMDVTDKDGKPVSNLAAKDFKALIADQKAVFDSVVPFETSGEDLSLVFIIDSSLSFPGPKFEQVRVAVRHWIASLDKEGSMALVSTGPTPRVLKDFASDQSVLLKAVDDLRQDSLRSPLYAALVEAMRLFKSRPHRGRQAIFLLTDGDNDDDRTGYAKKDVLTAIDAAKIPIFVIGINATPPTPDANQNLANMAEFARHSNGLYQELGTLTIDESFRQIREAIRRVYVGVFRCELCPGDGRSYGLQVRVAGMETPVVPVILFRTPPIVPWYQEAWVPIVVISGLLLAAGVAIWRNRRHPPAPHPALVYVDHPEVVTGLDDGISEAIPNDPNRSVPAGIRILLVTIGAPAQRFNLELSEKVVIGSGAGCEIVLKSDPSIADQHCEIYRRGRNIYARAFGGARSTEVNGVPLAASRKLETQDTIRVGNIELRIVFGNQG